MKIEVLEYKEKNDFNTNININKVVEDDIDEKIDDEIKDININKLKESKNIKDSQEMSCGTRLNVINYC